MMSAFMHHAKLTMVWWSGLDSSYQMLFQFPVVPISCSNTGDC